MNTQELQSANFCPFKGLEPYTEDYREFFFGRERDEKTIISNMYAAPLTVLYGASGVGKSSVLMAGVVPSLKQTPRIAVVTFRSWQGENFIELLKREVLNAVRKSTEKEIRVELTQSFETFLLECTKASGGAIFFILDQFEEYFLYHSASKADDSFDALFARAINRKDINAKFLLAMREEELSKLDRFRGRIPNLLGNTLRLRHLDRDSAERAIRGPLDQFNKQVGESFKVDIENGLVKALLDKATPDSDAFSQAGDGKSTPQEISDAYIETPILQLLLIRLWMQEKKDGSNTLRLDTFEKELCGAESIMGAYLNEVMNQLSNDEREIAASIFRFLVTPSRTKIAQDANALASWSDLNEGEVESLLIRLSSDKEMRMLRKVRFPGRAARYEIFHDVLARAILEWRAAFVQAQEQAKVARRAAREAARKEKDAAYAQQLQQAQALAQAERQKATEQQRRAEAERMRAEEQERRAEVERLRAEEQRLRVREQARTTARLRHQVVGLVVFFIFAVASAFFATSQRTRAQASARDAKEHEQAAIEQAEIARTKAQEAEQARVEEAKARQLAEEERQRAETQAHLAERRAVELEHARKEAVIAKQKAEAEREEAKRQKGLAEKQTEIARIKAQEAEQARVEEAKARQLAEEERQRAMEQARIAEEAKKKADTELAITIDALKDKDIQLRLTELLGEKDRTNKAIAKYTEELMRAEKDGNLASQAEVLTNIGSIYVNEGHYSKAIEPYKQALKIREKTFSPDRPEIASSLNSLAIACEDQGRYDEAEPLYQRAVSIWEKSLGPDHPYTLTGLNNLAILYRDEAKFNEAETLFKRVLESRRKVLGPEDLNTIKAMNDLAILYRTQGRLSESEQFFKQVLAIRQRNLEPDNPDVVTTQSGIARLYLKKRKFADAEPLLKRVLTVREKLYGPDHPQVAHTINDLGHLYLELGRYNEAELLLNRALDIRQKALGPEHPNVAISLNDLGRLYFVQVRYKEAEPLYRRALAIREKTLRPDHPDLAETLEQYAALLHKMGREDEAEQMAARAKTIREKHAQENPRS